MRPDPAAVDERKGEDDGDEQIGGDDRRPFAHRGEAERGAGSLREAPPVVERPGIAIDSRGAVRGPRDEAARRRRRPVS